MDNENLQAEITKVCLKFKESCAQLRTLNRRIKDVQKRLRIATSQRTRACRYNIRIQLCVLEGVRNMHYEYALHLADVLDDLRTKAGIIVIGDTRSRTLLI